MYTCVYTCRINRPASVPITASLFLHGLISLIVAFYVFLFSAYVVDPRRGLLLRLKSPMKTPVVNNSWCIFCPRSSKFLNIGSYYPMISFRPLSLANNKILSFLYNSHIRLIIRLVHLLVGIPLFFGMSTEHNTTAGCFPLKSPLECHHHMRDVMIPSFLPEHVQTINYNQWNLLPLQIHAKLNCSKFYRRLQFLIFLLRI